MNFHDEVDSELAEAALAKLRLDQRPDLTVEGLTNTYRAWCSNVPFDNVQKRVYFGEGRDGPMPGTTPAEFLQNFVDHGTGGTCWSTSGGLHALLRWIGFDAHRVSGNMVGVGEFDEPNHGSTAVQVEGQWYLVDTSILSHDPIPLVEGQTTQTNFPLNETTTEWTEGTFRITWLPGHSRDNLVMQLDGPGVGESRDFSFWAWRSEISRASSFFNDALYIRKSVGTSIRTLGRGRLFSIEPGPIVESRELSQAEVREALVGIFGLSEQIADAVPADREGLALG